VWIVSRISLGGNLILNFELWLVPCLRGDKGAGMVGIFGGNKGLQIWLIGLILCILSIYF
jgi:hypothetical protein